MQDFLWELRDIENLAPSSVNHYRTILNSTFNFAIKWKQYDENPVKAVHQIQERPGRDRFTTPDELVSLLEICEREQDTELKAFIILAATTGMRKSEILSRKHLSPLFKQQTVDMIADELTGVKERIKELRKSTDTPTDTVQSLIPLDGHKTLEILAERTGLEPATSDVTGRRSNQLNYHSAF